MAIVDAPRSKKNDPQESSQPAKAAKRKSRAFRYGALLTLAALLVGTYFAPWIIARTPLGPWAVQSALKLDGAVLLGSASLDWFSSVVVENLEIRDAAGDVLVTVEALRTDKPLIGLLLDPSDLGAIHVERPVVYVVALEQDTNLEQAFAALLVQPSGTRVAAQLEITDATVAVDDVPAGRKFRIENMAISCALSQVDGSVTLSAAGSVNDDKQPGTFQIDLQTTASADEDAALANGKIDCQSSALPLELLEPLVRRRIEKGQLSGRLSARLGGAWGDMAQGAEASVSGEVQATGLAFAAAALGDDRIQLDRLDMPCRITQNGDQLQIEQLEATCGLGAISLKGNARLSDLSAANPLKTLAHENYDLKGHVDLAELARLLPRTLRIREGTEITAGQVSLVLNSRQAADGTTWTGRVDTSHLEARENGRNLVWENPLAIEFATHETQDGLVVDSAQCNSSFLQVTAAGSVGDLTASARFDLAQLVKQLRQFSDLDQLQLAGQGQAQLSWKRTADDAFAAKGAFQAHGFQLVAPNRRPWQEDNLTANLDVAGQLAERSLKRLDRAQLSVSAGTERLEAMLAQAASDTATSWPLECSWRGQLASWAPRLESCFGLIGWDLAGGGAAEATLVCSSKAVEIQQAKAEFDQFQLRGNGWYVSERLILATLEGRCDLEKTRIDVTQARLTAGTTAVAFSHAALQSASDGWTLDGAAAQLNAELANLYRWRHDPRTPPTWQVSGKLAGEAELKYAAGVMTGNLSGAIDQLQVVDLSRPAGPNGAASAWREPRITLAGSGNYQTASQRLQLDKAEIAAAVLRCDVSGALALAAQGGDVDLKGTIGYDWQQLAPVWQPYVGAGVQVVGRQSRTFALRGRLSGDPLSSDSWRQVAGEASVGWAGMNVDGLGVGPGDVVMKLADGQLRTQPIDVVVSEGRFTAAPLVRLSPGPAEMFVPAGPLLTNIHLSPDMSSRGLRFLAPILAEATAADGWFSIVLDGGRIPLANVRAGDVSGRMSIRAQARPGPLAQQFVMLLGELTTILKQGLPSKLNDQSGALLSVDQSNVEFRLVNGRIYHRGLTIMAGTTPITTHGSVGLDETLSMVAEVPVRAKLLGIDLSLGTLEGTTLQIPIEGTLERPQIDRHVLDQFGGQLLQNATKGLLINEVKQTIEKLLPGQP